jgi:CysZ protein
MQKVFSGFGFFSGATYPFRTLGIFWRTPNLLGYLFFPIVVNIFMAIVLYASVLFFGWQFIQDLTVSLSQLLDNLTDNLPKWLSLIEYLLIPLVLLLRFLLIIIPLLLVGFLLVQFGVLLGAPWYGKLSEQLEKIRTGSVQNIEVGIVKDIGRAILFELNKLRIIITVGLPLLVLNFLPGIGTLISSIGGILLTGTIVCLDFFDSPLERRRISFRDKLNIVRNSLPASAGFGLVCLVLIGIPLLNLLTIPLCVASGTLFVCDRILPKINSST